MRQQRTLRHVIGCAGVGLHSGARVAVTLRPAAEGFGIRFRRVDRPGSPPIPTRAHHAVAIDGVISLASDAGGSVRMVEHVLGAVAACGIDNILVEISGPELPIMDGSARPFVLLMECAGTVDQARPAASLQVLGPVEVASRSGWARLEPATGLELVVESHGLSDAPAFTMLFSSESCKRELVGARDRAGQGVESDAGLRGDDEHSRHAALDALGALALIPAQIAGRYIECGADAALRCALLRELLNNPRNYSVTGSLPDAGLWPSGSSLARAS
jgi:UDP-3-O-[3-hydroxymyristoyl] N-acetylglucosamine deacetylase